MTLEELKALIDGVELRNFPYRATIRTSVRDWRFDDSDLPRRKRWLVVDFEQLIPHRDTGAISPIATSWGYEEDAIECFPGDFTEALDFFSSRTGPKDRVSRRWTSSRKNRYRRCSYRKQLATVVVNGYSW